MAQCFGACDRRSVSLVWEASETVARYTGSPHAAVPKISTAGAAMRGSTWVLKQNNQFDQ
jgi:hypothetical protein